MRMPAFPLNEAARWTATYGASVGPVSWSDLRKYGKVPLGMSVASKSSNPSVPVAFSVGPWRAFGREVMRALSLK